MGDPEFANDQQGYSAYPDDGRSLPGQDEPRPPSNIESEQAILGALLMNNASYDEVASILTPEMFFDPLHAQIYTAISTLIEKGQTVTPITLKNRFEGEGILEEIGGTKYLARLSGAASTLINIRHYADTLRDAALMRGIMEAGQEAIWSVQHRKPEDEPDAMLDAFEGRLDDLRRQTTQGSGAEAVTVGKATSLVFERLDTYTEEALIGISTGLEALDRRTGGLEPRNYNILAGRPGMGKTLVACEIALAAARAGYGVLYSSKEMPAHELSARFMASMASKDAPIAYSDILKRRIDWEQRQRLNEAADELADLNITIADRGNHKVPLIGSLVRQARRTAAKTQRTIDLLIVDHVGHLQPVGRHNGNKNGELTEISNGLLSLSMDMDLSVLALSQLSRLVESRDDKRPYLSDLRDSGSLEQDAHVVMFCYREEYYLRKDKRSLASKSEAKREEWAAKWADAKDRIEIITEKQRNGSTGEDIFFCDVKSNRVRDL